MRRDLAIPAGAPRRMFGADAAHLRRCGLRSSLTHQRMRSLRCSAAPSIWTTWAPNLSPRSPAVIARIVVTPKPVVNDPQGITVKQGLATLGFREVSDVSLIHISEPTRLGMISYAVFCLKKKKD